MTNGNFFLWQHGFMVDVVLSNTERSYETQFFSPQVTLANEAKCVKTGALSFKHCVYAKISTG